MENPTNLLPIGAMLQNGKYRVERHLGSGGFGNTYLIIDTATQTPLAMKEFYLKGVNERSADTLEVSVSNADNRSEFEAQKAKFRKEATRLQQLRNPNVVRVYSLFEENGTAYYVMDFLQGASLSARMKQQGHPFDEYQVLNFTDQLLAALEAVHNQNIWHLDLKPGNVMTDADGRLVLIDFGASKQFHDADGRSLSTSTGLCYTPGYAPTEQIAGEVSRMGPWTDLYALGATMYNLLTNETPPSVSAIQDGGAFHFPPNVSEPTRRLVAWLMEPGRNQRPRSVADVRYYMAAHFAPAAPAAASVETRLRRQPPVYNNSIDDDDDDDEQTAAAARRRNWLIAGGVGLAAVLVVGLILLLGKGDSKRHYDFDDDDEDDLYALVEDSIAVEVEDYEEPQAEAYDPDSLALAQQFEREAQQQAEQRAREAEQARQRELALVEDSIAAYKAERERTRQQEEQRARKAIQARQRELDSIAAYKAELERELLRQQEQARAAAAANNDANRVYDVAEQMPSYPGGDGALMQFLATHIKYPVVAEENGIQGRVLCSFVVERDGSITDVKVSRGVDPSLDKEAVRVLRSMPRWIPGKLNGQAVRVKYTVPVTFKLSTN